MDGTVRHLQLLVDAGWADGVEAAPCFRVERVQVARLSASPRMLAALRWCGVVGFIGPLARGLPLRRGVKLGARTRNLRLLLRDPRFVNGPDCGLRLMSQAAVYVCRFLQGAPARLPGPPPG